MPSKVFGIDSKSFPTSIEIVFNEKIELAPGDGVIFKDPDGKEEYGILKYVANNQRKKDFFLEGAKVLRKATLNDVQKVENYNEQKEHSLDVCKKLVKKHDLNMTVFEANHSFDGARVNFMFTADDRVDFRELVKDLAKSLQKQIHLRQIGPRDKAKLTGGYGKCGRSLCCSTFLDRLESINMDMVRDQSLESKGSSKLSGACGKLLCCLKYEVEAYRSLRKNLPDFGSIIRLKKSTKELSLLRGAKPAGAKAAAKSREGQVIALDILNQKLKVYIEGAEPVTVSVDDIEKVISKPALKNNSDKK